MGLKRKREIPDPNATAPPVLHRPKAGTKAFVSGKAVKDGLDTGSPQAFVSFRQQIVTPHSSLPLAITNPTVIILQHYLDASPTCDEIFRAWQVGDQTKNEQQTHAAVELLSEIINILTPVPFFRTSVIGLVNKIVAPTEPYHDYLNRLVQSGKRDDVYHGYLLASAAMSVDPPTAVLGGAQTIGQLGMKVWSTLVEGGSVRGLGKQMGMRRRNKEGMVAYSEKDPLDKPDIRHLILRTILPLLSTSAFHAHARNILPPLYAGLAADPPLTVLRILTGLWDAISGQSAGLNRRTSLVLFHERSIENLWQLLSRGDKEETTGKTISEMVMAFLENITATPGKGVCFPDAGWYPRKVVDETTGAEVEEGEVKQNGGVGDGSNDSWRQGLHNRILGNVVRKVGHKAVDDDGLVGDWMVKVFEACPELIAGYWAHSALALDPRLNARWIATMAYVGRIISLPPPALSTFKQPVPSGVDPSIVPFRAQPPALSTMIESILPSPLTRTHVMRGLQHTDGLVQHVTAITLARGLQKLAIVQDLFKQIEADIGAEPSTSQENPWARRRRELEMEARKRIPELGVIIAFAQKAATMAPAEPETDIEIALASKSAMLTEVALRLFGLCNKTMPTMAQEVRFDVGRLLVSASSASAERRAKREAREGSVISDSGSVASVGTIGTAGMGGGFGQARGNVEGFEALSQLHVLQLLSEVKDWSWMNKAAGSQYTYLYHILLLNLSTRQSVTFHKTISLVKHLLLPTLLFEHDTAELDIWLEALPRSSDTVSGPMLLAQQIHLLSFLDDCFRRCVKTPYRYIEDTFAVVPDFFEYTRPTEMISPVVMTVVEQLSAKIMGQLISTEAAGVVMGYLRRVLLAMTSKQKEFKFLFAIVEKLDELLQKAKDAGQARVGLKELVKGMKGDLSIVSGKKSSAKAEEPADDTLRLREESEWAQRSFEKTSLTTSSQEWATADLRERLSAFVISSNDWSIVRKARFILHLLSGKKSILDSEGAKQSALTLLHHCLRQVRDVKAAAEIKYLIFENPSVKALIAGDEGKPYRSELDALISLLDESSPTDQAVAQTFVQLCIDLLQADKKGKNVEGSLALLRPWIRFLQSDPAKQTAKVLIKRVDKIAPSITSEITEIISSIIVATRDPAFAIGHLTALAHFKVIDSVVNLLESPTLDRETSSGLSKLSVKKDAIRELLAIGDDSAYKLLANLVASSVKAAKSVISVLTKDSTTLADSRILPTVEHILELPSDKSLDVVSLALTALTKSSSASDVQKSAVRILTSIASQEPQKVNEAITGLTLADFRTSTAQFVEALAKTGQIETRPAVLHLVELGLQYAVRLCSNDAAMPEEGLLALKSLFNAITSTDELEIKVSLAEPVVMAVIEDRLEVAAAVELATLLTTRVELRASFIRQQLQALLNTPVYSKCTSSDCPPVLRLTFTSLLHALFSASTYVSCQPNFIEPLILLYRGTMSEPDRKILHLFQLFEAYRKLSVASILKYWSATGILSAGERSWDALNSLDPQKVFATCQAYPVRRPLRGWGKAHNDREPEAGEGLYDPVFMMSLLASTLGEGTRITGLDWVEILRSNVLGLTICGLSSRDKDIRQLSQFVLSKAFSLIIKTPFYEREQLVYTLRLLRHAIPTPTSRLPTLTTLFFAHSLRSLGNPAHFLYPISSRFLLQRPVFDTTDTPMLYSMLYASEDGWKRERGWMVRFLRDGLRSEADWRVVRRRQVWSLLATLFSSSLDPAFRRSVLQVMESMTAIQSAARSLVLRDGLIIWLAMQWTNISRHHSVSSKRGSKPQVWERDEKATILKLVDQVCAVMVRSEHERVKEGKELGGWMKQVEVFVRRVLEGDIDATVDAERLEYVAKIVYRLSEIPGNRTTAILLPLLVQKLNSIKDDSRKQSITILLFRAGLNLRPEELRDAPGLGKCVDEIKWSVERGDGGMALREWVRRERRLIQWDEEEGKKA
ncbi:hypothetical protein CI109_100763 [Kwoniella shandongensis]|uniref:Uncharacterized protein n=1 Tax=Kwoniella shandongensis TaxID=1734106 RepID=A0A5M6BUY6_9TREE|nr:uncharacterized protein CI109_005057 [Kwoniella shandongensis]KAA5526667.1 hypothetical protein CI109_005057 [Kwoniella shandongensis]